MLEVDSTVSKGKGKVYMLWCSVWRPTQLLGADHGAYRCAIPKLRLIAPSLRCQNLRLDLSENKILRVLS